MKARTTGEKMKRTGAEGGQSDYVGLTALIKTFDFVSSVMGLYAKNLTGLCPWFFKASF